MKSKIMPSLVLGSICLVAALLLSVVNMFTAPLIEANKAAAASGAFAEVLPGATGKQDLTIDDSYPAVVKAGYKFDNGYVFQMEVSGWSSGLIIMCGIGNDGKITGMKHIQTNDTYGLEPELNNAYTGKDIDTAELVIATGATPKSLTSKGYFEAVTAALQSFAIANGGTVDLRTPEQILQDNCNAALGVSGKTFTKWFAVEKISGIDAVYEASDNSGRVYVIGEAFIGVKDGAVTTADASGENKSAALSADAVIGALTKESVAKPAGTNANVESIERFSNGTYVFELKGDGYQAMFDWGDGTQIDIKVAIGADGKIIDVVTVAHAESKGYGDECATEEYYKQYFGKGDSDIKESADDYPYDHGDDFIDPDCTDVGAISSATFTTLGYQRAIKAAFAAFELLNPTEGGNQ